MLLHIFPGRGDGICGTVSMMQRKGAPVQVGGTGPPSAEYVSVARHVMCDPLAVWPRSQANSHVAGTSQDMLHVEAASMLATAKAAHVWAAAGVRCQTFHLATLRLKTSIPLNDSWLCVWCKQAIRLPADEASAKC